MMSVAHLNGRKFHKILEEYMDLTLSIIKPDAVKRNLIGNINALIENNKIKIVAQKMIKLSIDDAQNFYFVHKERAFF